MDIFRKRLSQKVAFGERLAQARTRLQLSQEALAEVIGTTARSISRWEHNQALPQQYYLERLCEALQTTPEALFVVDEEQQQTVSPSAPLWYVPYIRNPYFTGREAFLSELHERLQNEQRVALTQRQILSGLGGIGKTQTALEYAYRYRDNYQAVLWVGAETSETVLADYQKLARLFQLPEQDSSDHHRLREGIKRWFQNHANWLLIFDNVEDLELLQSVLPDTSQGYILITTRSQMTGSLGVQINVQKMALEEGALFLLRRAKLLPIDSSLETVPPGVREQADRLVNLLDGLPLALDQASAYIEETACSLSDYLECYAACRRDLLSTRGELSNQHPASVTTTFCLSIQKVEQASPLAADLLRLCAFLHADAIPQEFITQAGETLGTALQSLSTNPLAFDTAVKELRRYSLIHREPETRTLSIHRLLQAIILDEIDERGRKLWMERIIQAMLRVFPAHTDVSSYDFGNQSYQQRCLPHALTCAALLKEWKIATAEAAEFLYRVAHYFKQFWGSDPYTILLLFQAIELAEQTLGKDHPTTALYLYVLGVFSISEKHYTQGESCLQRALEIREKVWGTDHLEVAEVLENLANLYARQGKYRKAFLFAHRALVTEEKSLGVDHYTVILTLNSLGNISLMQGRYDLAQQFFHRALALSETTIGENHFFVAFIYRSLGLLYFFEKQFTQAKDAYKRALAILERKLRPSHPSIAFVLTRLGVTSFAQQEYQQAEVFSLQALRIYENHPGLDSSDLTHCRLILGQLYFVQGKKHLAQRYLQHVFLTLGEPSQGLAVDYQTIIRCLLLRADQQMQQGNLMQAHRSYQEVLILIGQELASDHPLIKHCQNTLDTLFSESKL